MAKNFPYFKFIAHEWMVGDIFFEEYELQGIFISSCAIYWQRDGNVTLEYLEKRIKNDRLNELIGKYIEVMSGNISIKFLDEQLIGAGHISKINSENGKKGGRPKTEIKPIKKRNESENKATAFNSVSESKANEKQIRIRIKEEEEKEEEINNNLVIVDEVDYLQVHQSFADRLLLNDLECQSIFEVSEKRVTFELLNTFIAHLTNQSKVYNHYSEFKKHFSNWMRKHEPNKSGAGKSKVDTYLENNLEAKRLLGI
jgi:hypothetical protein